MIEVGRVIKVKGQQATVEFERKTACDKCGMCAFKKDEMFVKCTLNNKLHAKIGDLVTVHMGKNYVLTAACIAYLIPLVLCAIVIGCTYKLADYIQFIGVIVSLVIGFTIAGLLDKYVIRKKEGFRPTMIGILDKNKIESMKKLQDMDEVELDNLSVINSNIEDNTLIVSSDGQLELNNENNSQIIDENIVDNEGEDMKNHTIKGEKENE